MARVRMTRGQKLARRGIYYIEVDGVLAYLSKKTSAATENCDLHRHRPLLRAMQILAIHTRDRVKSGWFAEGTSPKAYATGHKFAVTPEYARLAGLDEKKAWYTSSAAFHEAAHAKPGTGWVTGGMWGTLQVVEGKDRAGNLGTRIEFGQGITEAPGKVVKQRIAVTQDGKTRYRTDGVVVRRQEKGRTKAWGVWQQGVNPVEFRQSEVQAIADALYVDWQKERDRTFGVERTYGAASQFDADPALTSKLAAGWR